MSLNEEALERINRMRRAALSLIAQSSETKHMYVVKPYAAAHLRKVHALADEIMSELDFTEFAILEGR